MRFDSAGTEQEVRREPPYDQQYERRSKDINKAAGAALRSLAQVLSCRIEDLLAYPDDQPDLYPGIAADL